MAGRKDNIRALLFEELEPRLLFSADVAEPLAAEAVQEQLAEEPLIIVAEITEQQDVPAADNDSGAADTSSATAAADRSPADTFEITDNDGSGNRTIPSAPETSSTQIDTGFSEIFTEGAAAGELNTDTQDSNATGETDSASADPEAAGSFRRELVLVNDNVRDIDELVASIDFPDGASGILEVIILDTGRDGIEQVSEILSAQDRLDAIHIVTHGRDGQLALGSNWLDSDDLQEKSDSLAAWGESLSADGDILLYGCSIAAGDTGEDFIDSLSELTGADVSASDDPTGHELLGGDWELEYAAGTMETSSPLNADTRANWEQLLVATIEDDFNTVTYSGSTGSINWSSDWQELVETDGADAGNVSIYSHPRWGSQPALSIWKTTDGVWREVNLSGATTATLSFDYMLEAGGGEFVTVEVSTDGGSSWNLVATFSGPDSYGVLQTVNYDISSYIDNDTRIKFESSASFGTSSEFILDNVVIDFDASIITVNTTVDVDDGDHDSIEDLILDPGSDGFISLREAIIAANNTNGLDRINFNIPGAGPHIITLDPSKGELEDIDDALIIDGTSEPDYIDAPVIQIDGSAMSAVAGDNFDGFRLVSGSDGSTIRGLSITGFTDGGSYGEAIVIRSDNNIIAGNYIGVAPDGTTPDGNTTGVLLTNGAEYNLIGGTDAADKNIISASSYAGVTIQDENTSGNRIIGNDIGHR